MNPKYKPGDALFLKAEFYSRPPNYSWNQIVIDKVENGYYHYHLVVDPTIKKALPAPNYNTSATIQYVESIYIPNKTIPEPEN